MKNQQKLVEIKIEVQPFDDNNEENNTFFDDTDDESDVTEVSNQIFIKEVRSLYVPPKETSKSLEKSSQDVEVSKPPKPKKKKALPKKTPRELYLEKMYPCTMCAKMVVQNRMEGHINKHNGLRPFVCNTDGCVKDFFCPVVMSLHKQYSHGPFKFPCKICNKSFGTKVTLKIHSFCHNDRNIQCDLCGKKSKSKKALKKHMVSHSGIRNFQCKMCHQSFYTNHNLNAHERIHTKERPYKVSTL